MVFVTVTGADEVMDLLKSLSSEKQFNRIAYKLATETAKLAYQLAPEDTGKMENDIRVEGSNGQYEVVCDIRYAVYNEFGTYKMPVGDEESPLAITSTSGKAAYRPFLRPAAYQILDQLPEIINSVFFGRIVSLGDE